jgi:hypothetical protein
VERLRRYLRRPPALGGDDEEPAPAQRLDGRLEHEVEVILKFSMRAGRPHVLVRLTGLDASGDTSDSEAPENLTNCEDAIRAFEQARGLVLPQRLAPRRLRLHMHAAELRLSCPLLGIPWTRALVTSVQP